MKMTLGFLSGIGGWELLIIILFVLIFFGAKKIPEIARGLGKGIREFKDATKEIKKEIEEPSNDSRVPSSSNQTKSQSSSTSISNNEQNS